MKEGVAQSDGAAIIQPRVLLKPGSWLEKIDFINHLILFNNELITVLSEKEGGKSSFAALLQANLDSQIKSVSIAAIPTCTKEDILREIVSKLHLNHDLYTDLSSIAAYINECKAHVLLIIDDAQHLPDSLIKEAILSIKNQEDLSFFHLCFVSDHSIVSQNLDTLFFDKLVQAIELGPLNESETRTYVLQRAMAAHLISRPLTDVQYKQFYQLTKGNVAKINKDLETFVVKCTGQKKKNPMNGLKKAFIAASIVLISGYVGFYFSQLYDISSFFYLKTASPKIENIENKVVTLIEPKAQPKPLVSYIASWENSSTRQLVYASMPTKQIFDDSDDYDDEVPTNTVAIVDKVVVIPKVQLNNLAQEKPQKAESQVIAKAKFVASATSTHKKATKSSKVNLYTIQLAASHSKKDLERFKHKNKFLANAGKLRHFTNANGVWYVLTIGEYESRRKAQSSLSKLPAQLVKLNPWIREVSSLG
jgi:type II secretory pathway predicted ATPase ExeA